MHKSVALVVCSLVCQVATATTSQEQDCPNLFTKIGSKCYHFSTEIYDFDDARIFCQGLVDPVNGTADLAVLGFDYVDFYHVANYMNQAGLSVYWVGLTDLFNTGDWLWLDGTPMSLSSIMWACDEPFAGDYYCAILYGDRSSTADRIHLQDTYCTNTLPALCQYGVSVKDRTVS